MQNIRQSLSGEQQLLLPVPCMSVSLLRRDPFPCWLDMHMPCRSPQQGGKTRWRPQLETSR